LLRKIKKSLHKSIKSEFFRNVGVLVSGNVIAQAIPILLSPVFTRIYSPENFGILALYVGLVNVLINVTTGRYEFALVLPKSKEKVSNLFVLTVLISFGSSLIFLLLVILFNKSIAQLLNNEEIGFWLYLLPLSLFLRGTYQAGIYWFNQSKAFKEVTYSRITQTSATNSTKLGFGFLGYGSAGMIISSIIGGSAASIFVVRKMIKDDRYSLRQINMNTIIALGRRYKKFPKYSMPAGLLNSFSVQLPVFLLSSFFNSTIVGFYSLSHRILTMPMRVIGKSIADVYYQKISSLNDKNKLAKFTFSVYKKLLLIGIIPLGLIMAFGDYIFGFVFGDEWTIAGKYAQYLSLWVLFNFISSPLSRLFLTLEKQQKSLVVNVVLLFFRAAPLIIGAFIYVEAFDVIKLFSIISVVFWIGYCYYLLKEVNIRFYRFFFYTLFVIGVIVIPLFLIRFVWL